jgi:hypothetical protein
MSIFTCREHAAPPPQIFEPAFFLERSSLLSKTHNRNSPVGRVRDRIAPLSPWLGPSRLPGKLLDAKASPKRARSPPRLRPRRAQPASAMGVLCPPRSKWTTTGRANTLTPKSTDLDKLNPKTPTLKPKPHPTARAQQSCNHRALSADLMIKRRSTTHSSPSFEYLSTNPIIAWATTPSSSRPARCTTA